MANRFIYQEKLPFWQQETLARKLVVIVGCGALGSHLANQLVRLGCGRLLLIDPDVVEESNLHRTALYTQEDIGTPKVAAAKARLRQIDPHCQVAICRTTATLENLPALLKGADLVLDGLDNMAGRYALNKICQQLARPWVYGGLLGTSGMVLPIIPGKSACLHCLLPTLGQQEPPTTSDLGILPTLPQLLAAFQVTAALKILLGQMEDQPKLLTIDLWTNEINYLAVQKNVSCATCA